MNAWDKGPAGVFELDDAPTFWQPEPTGGYVTLTMTPESFAHDHSASGFQVIPPGGTLPLQSHKAAEKLWYVYEGTAELAIDGEIKRLHPGVTVAMGRKVPHSLVNDGEEDLRLFFWVTPPSYEGLLEDWGVPRTPGEAAPSFEVGQSETRRSPILLGDAAAEAGIGPDKGQWVLVEPEGGDVFWQYPPAGGYMQWKTTTETFNSNRFFSCIQVLPPGGQIPAHIHPRNEEWLLVRSGHGTAFIDGEAIPVKPGTLAFVDRWVVHSFRNDSDEPMELFVIFTPPGLEKALPAVSVAKSDANPTEPDWAQFVIDFPMPTVDLIDDMWKDAAIHFPHVAAMHNSEAVSPVKY